MMRTQFFVRMKGDLATHLSDFRERVGLNPEGRLSDDWDQQFGWLELRPREQGWVELGLSRGFTDDDWKVRLIYEQDPLPEVEADQLRRRVLDAAAAAGMTVTAQSGAMKFDDTYVSKQDRYSLGIECRSGRYYASIPVSNGIVDYEEYYELTGGQYEQFLADTGAAVAFVEACRRREHDRLLLQQPGTNRGTPV